MALSPFHTLSITNGLSKNICDSFSPPLISENDMVSNSTREADLFARQFAVKFSLNAPANLSLPSITVVPYNMSESAYRVNHVRKILFSHNIVKSSGLDGIPVAVVLKCIFQASHDEGIFQTAAETTYAPKRISNSTLKL